MNIKEVWKKFKNFSYKNIKLMAIIFIIIGILFFIIGYFIPVLVIRDIFITFSTVLISFAVGTVLINFFDFSDYIIAYFKVILADDDYIDCLKHDKKVDLLKKLEQEVYFSDIDENLKNIFYNMQESVLDLSREGYYYINYRVNADVYIRNNSIKKVIKRVIQLRVTGQNIEVNISFKYSTFKVDRIKEKDMFKIVEFTINGVPQNTGVSPECSITNNIVTLEYEKFNINLNDGTYELIIVTENYTCKNDSVSIHVCSVLCERALISCRII